MYALPVFSDLISIVFFCFGGFLIPVIAGLLYGYFTPGKETLQHAALGGGVSGVVAGIAYGILNVIMLLIFALVNSGDIADAVAYTTGQTNVICVAAVIFSFTFGAVGGFVWTAALKDK